MPSDGEDIETQFSLETFPHPNVLWERYKRQHNIKDEEEELVVQPNHTDSSDKEPRYYQVDAINRTIEAIAKREKESCWLWLRVQVKLTPLFKLSGVCGKQGSQNEFFFLWIEIFWQIRLESMISSHSVRL